MIAFYGNKAGARSFYYKNLAMDRMRGIQPKLTA